MMKSIALISLSLSLLACAAPSTNEAIEATPPTTQETAKMTELNENNDQAKAYSDTDFIEVTMWQKSPGTAIYNNKGEVVGSLRLRPSVTVYETNEGWARIDVIEDKWVKLSDLSLEPVDGMLLRPVESNGMERINRDALKEALETGVRPGEQE